MRGRNSRAGLRSSLQGLVKSGFGRETHKMILDHYQQTKNLLVSYSPNAMGFF